ncbi:AAA family ATPase [Glutamicibacter arilaitensis]|uniref:AAA family ATPase n=1 Tax=Glutamicibacter arilaitensis TaxID=256701 RepID=UPI003F8F549F
MRIHKLQIQAFGPFAGTEEINFDELAEGGLFLLDGPTGAGKSSILDAICYALYGALPGSRTGSRQIRSDHAPTGLAPEVSCELTIGDRRFEVTRSPAWMRPSKRGKDKTTEQKASSLLREFTASGWNELSTRNDEVGHVLGSLLGLDREQFTKVVMLPQGGFADFLRAKAKDREDLLANLFDTSDYAQIEEEFSARLAEERQKTESLEARLSASEEAIHAQAQSFLAGRESNAQDEASEDTEDSAQAAHATVAEQFADYQRRISVIHQRAASEAAALRAQRTGLREQVQSVEERQRIFARLAELRSKQAAYAQQHEAALSAGARLEKDAKAGAVRAYLTQLNEAKATEQKIKDTWLASQQWLEKEQGLAPRIDIAGLESLRRPAQEAAEALAIAKAALEDEKRREVLAAQGEKAAELVGVHAKTRTEAEEEVLRLKTEREALEAQDLDQGAATEKVQQAKDRVLGLETKIGHATERDGLEKKAMSAREKASAQELKIVDAANSLLDLRTEQLAQSALRLSAALEDGKPCMVCGSEEHPAPAQADAGAPLIDDEQIQKLDAIVAAARVAGQQAAQTRDTLMAKLQAAQEAAGDQMVAELRVELEAAQAELEQARQKHNEISVRISKLDKVRRRVEEQNARAAQAVLEHSAAQHNAQTLQAQLEELDAKLVQLRQGKNSLSELVEQQTKTSNGLGNAFQNLRRLLEASQALERATATWDAERTAAGFAQLAEYEAALLEASQREQLRQLQRADADLASAIATLESSEDCRKAQELSSQGIQAPGEDELVEARLLATAADERFEAAREQEVLALTQLTRHEQATGDLERQRADAGPVIETYRRLRGLAEVIRGGGENLYKMTLSTYVLAARLEEVAIAATQRLAVMSAGRYSLHHDDSKQGNAKSGLGLQVLDSWTGKRRETQTLSGGETFMASLALALGLADVISHHSGAVDMQTLFVDEGFGSLDAETLEEVMQALENLRAGGRTIGLVSHVAEMKQRITNRVSVIKTQHGSTIAREGTVILAG